MVEQTQNLEGTVTATAVPIVVKIKPGTSSNKGLMFTLEPGMENYSVQQLVNHAMNTYNNDPQNQRIIGKINTELAKNPGYNANQTSVKANEKVSAYIGEEKTLEDGTKYKELEIIVASAQEGGKVYRR